MATKKAPNYTAEMTAEFCDLYTAAETDAERLAVLRELENRWGKSLASLRQKASREGFYVKPEKATNKTGGQTKEMLATKIAEAMGENAEVFDSLAKPNRIVLARILAYITNANKVMETLRQCETDSEIVEVVKTFR